jgi:hypothetical protein
MQVHRGKCYIFKVSVQTFAALLNIPEVNSSEACSWTGLHHGNSWKTYTWKTEGNRRITLRWALRRSIMRVGDGRTCLWIVSNVGFGIIGAEISTSVLTDLI